MKQDIKDGKNVSVGDITVINEGISLAEKVEEQSEVSASAPAVEDAVQVAVPEITPDVVVGENENNSLDNVVPFPIPVEMEPANENNAVTPIDIPSVIPTDPIAPEASIIPEIPSIPNNFNSNMAVFPQNVSSFNNNPNTFQSDFNNVVYPQFGSNISNEPVQSPLNFNNERNGSLNSFTGGYYNDELPPNIENAMKILKDVANEINDLKDKIRSKDARIETLEQEKKVLLNDNAFLKNQVANSSAQIEATRNRLLEMFGMPKNTVNQYPSFNDSQSNNNGMNIAA